MISPRFARVLFAAGALCTGAAAFAQALPEQDVVASQGGATVTLKDIDAYAQKIPEADRAGFFDNPKRIETVIMTLLLTKQLAAEARTQKIDQDPSVQLQMAQSADDALARADMDHFRKGLTLPSFDNLAKEYYVAHKSEFVQPGEIDVKHVLVSNKERGDDAAKARIGEVEAAAKTHPEQFDELVEKYSDDPSKSDNHGLMVDAGSEKYVPPFVEAAKALKKPGEISPVVKTQYGYHVLKLVERKADVQHTFAESREALIQKLRNEHIERLVTDHMAEKRNQPLDANADLVASIRTRFLPAGQKLPSEAAAEANAAAMQKAVEAEQKKQADGKH